MERCRCSCLGPSISSPRCLQSYPKSPCEIRKNSRSCSGCYGNVAAGVSQQLPGAGSRAWSPRGSPRCSPRRRSHPVLGLSPHRGLVLPGCRGLLSALVPKASVTASEQVAAKQNPQQGGLATIWTRGQSPGEARVPGSASILLPWTVSSCRRCSLWAPQSLVFSGSSRGTRSASSRQVSGPLGSKDPVGLPPHPQHPAHTVGAQFMFDGW